MINLETILEHLNEISATADKLCYNIDCFQKRAEEMLKSEKVSFSRIKSLIKHFLFCQKVNHNLSFANFDKLSKKEQIYYAAVESLRSKAVEEYFN